MIPKLRIVPLGGLGEIGKNMTVIEYNDSIIIIDAGIMFPENDMLGIDTIIPDYQYLEDKFDKIEAVLITHAHEDHVGALQHLMRDVDAPIYATPLTIGLIEGKLRQARLLHEVDLRSIDAGEVFQVGPFKIEPFHVAHSIPDCVGFGITTPVGLIVHTGDYKFDHTPADGWPPDFAKLAEFSERGVLALLADSTNADKPGWTPSETVVAEGLDEVFRNAKGRIIVATFGSLISRIQQVADAAVRHGRKLAITGRSMRENTKVARRMGYLTIPDDLLVDIDQVGKMPPSKIVIMATGAQGEPSAVLGRLSHGRHRNLSIQEGDTVVFSAHAIPGNEEMINRTINRLYQRGADVLYDQIARVHVSGHASREEMKLMINLIRPQYLIPVHGELRHLRLHGQLGEELGIPQENIAVIENGTPLELTSHSITICPRMPGGYVFVDGAGVGDIGWSVVRDRDKLAQSGYYFATILINKAGDLVGSPEFITRGFVENDAVEALDEGATEAIKRTLKNAQGSDQLTLKKRLQESLGRYLYEETRRRPIVEVSIKGTSG
ncbi:MAG: ribonuclease J [Candidatus Promineifilaceae bacterium]